MEKEKNLPFLVHSKEGDKIEQDVLRSSLMVQEEVKQHPRERERESEREGQIHCATFLYF